jgi:predicted secreted protein with PEFG-CTERM motif
MGSNYEFPVLSSMNINEENKSIDIVMETIPEKTDFWVRMPDDVISAENEKFIVLVDGVDTGYDLMKFPSDHVIGFFIDEDTKNIQIIGTQVIPEFGNIAMLILVLSIISIVVVSRRFSLVRF